MISYTLASLINIDFSIQCLSFLFSLVSIITTTIIFIWNLSDRKRNSIPVLLLDEDLVFSEPYYYSVYDDECLPINLIINNNSIASAFNVKISVKPNFNYLVKENLVKKTSQDSIYEDNHAYKINHDFDLENPYFFFSKNSHFSYQYHESFQIKRDSIKGNHNIKISSREIFELNNLIDSYLSYTYNPYNNLVDDNNDFYIPLVIKIEYNSIKNKKYFTIYDLAIRVVHKTIINVNEKMEIQKFGFQILKNEVSTNTFEIK